jgi:hypothetical protein
MKEGYIQLKIAEINDKCKNIEQIINFEKSKIKLLEEKIGGFKNLIKKLEDIDNFKTNLLKEIKKENKMFLEDEINKVSKKIASDIENVLIKKIKDIENKIKYITEQEENLDKQILTIKEINNKINYLLNYNNFLMMKLVNKAVLSDREVNEMHMRSTKESKK